MRRASSWPRRPRANMVRRRSEEHTSELQSHRDLHSFPTRRSSDLILICAANSTGGVMGKMIDAQSIVVASAATGQHGSEGPNLRFVFWQSLALALLMGVLVLV